MAREQKKSHGNYCVFDYETTGLDYKIHMGIELAAVIIDGASLEKIGEFECIIAPYMQNPIYDPRAMAVHGISLKEINNGLPLVDAIGSFIQFVLSKQKSNLVKDRTLLIAHNAKFDKGFLQDQVSRVQRELIKRKIDFSKAFLCDKELDLEITDTLHLSRFKWDDDKEMTSYKLSSCVEKMGGKLNDGHRAINDVHETANMFIKWCKLLRQVSGPVTIVEQSFRDTFQF